MINELSKDLVILIYKKFHRFTYLDKLLLVNKETYNIIKYINNFHYNKLKIYLKTLFGLHLYQRQQKGLYLRI